MKSQVCEPETGESKIVELCDTCYLPVKMMCMGGTGYFSLNCQDSE